MARWVVRRFLSIPSEKYWMLFLAPNDQQIWCTWYFCWGFSFGVLTELLGDGLVQIVPLSVKEDCHVGGAGFDEAQWVETIWSTPSSSIVIVPGTVQKILKRMMASTKSLEQCNWPPAEARAFHTGGKEIRIDENNMLVLCELTCQDIFVSHLSRIHFFVRTFVASWAYKGETLRK